MRRRLRDSAKGVRRISAELLAELNAKETAVFPDGSGRRFKLRLASRSELRLSIARSARRFRRPPELHGLSGSKKGNICNLIAILIAIYLYVAMQPLLRFKIFFAPHQALFVAFSLSILGYALLPLTAAGQAPSPTPDSSTTAATIYLLSDSLATMFWAGGILGSAGSCTGLLISYWLVVTR